MKMKFDIQYRPRIESGKYGVETADGHPVRIICWDAMPEWPVCAMIKDFSPASTYGYPQLFDEDGKSINDRAKDLVIVIPDPELTEFETAYLRLVHRLSPGDILPEFVEESHLRENCMELMDIARRQFEPELLAAVMKGRKEALAMTAEDILNFKLSNPVAWASVVGPEIKAARIEGKEDALKDPKREWSEEDEHHINSLLSRLDGICKNEFVRTTFAVNEDKDWLKLLRYKAIPQKQEWSEDDERIRKISIGLLEVLRSQGYATRESIDWLKSLRPPNRWKPSEEQIKTLDDAIIYINATDNFSGSLDVLKNILKQLKKLREE